MSKIGVMIVDDSAIVRQTLTEIFESDSELEVIATASDPIIAAKKLQDEVPDVIVLDIEMPRMDGLTFLKKIMAQQPIPVVICSSKTEDGIPERHTGPRVRGRRHHTKAEDRNQAIFGGVQGPALRHGQGRASR